MLPKESQVSNLLGQKLVIMYHYSPIPFTLDWYFYTLTMKANLATITLFVLILFKLVLFCWKFYSSSLVYNVPTQSNSPLKSRTLFIFDGPRYQPILNYYICPSLPKIILQIIQNCIFIKGQFRFWQRY